MRDWRREVVGTVNTFASARLRREVAVNARQIRPHEERTARNSKPDSSTVAANARARPRRANAESDQAASDRVRAINAAADIVPLPPRLLLVLASRS